MGWRLLHLYHLQQAMLLRRFRILYHQSLRHVGPLLVLNTLLFSSNTLYRPLYLLGYIPSHNRVYLTDKDLRIYGYALSLSVVEYQTAILRGDTEAAADILPTLPKDQLNKVARFLEARGMSFLLPFNSTFH